MSHMNVPLPDDLRRGLNEAAAALGRPATEIAREAMRDWLAAWSDRKLAEEIRSYAREMAGTSADLDPALESAGIASLSTADPSEAE